ncbi:MAG TPA: outer membrane protein transport protein [Vicinamibacteria bacterium]|nr:outer membrane protein transport protein [Vicinamibacteria bacterium]
MNRRSASRLLAAALTLALAALPAAVQGSGFQLFEHSASGLGNAYAGQAAGVKDASAIYFNPAALTRVKGWNVVASVEPIGLSTTFTDTGSSGPYFPTTTGGKLPFPVPLGDTGGDAGKWIAVPSGYVSGQLGDKVFVGVGVDVPFGLQTEWSSTFMGRFRTTKSRVHALNVNPTIAFQVNDVLSLGVGADYQHLSADLNQMVAYGSLAYGESAAAIGSLPLPPAVQGALLGSILGQLGGPAGLASEGPALLSGTSDAWGWNAGALLKLGDQAHVGVSYRSKITHDVDGTITFQGAPTLSESGLTGAIGAAINAGFADGPVTTQIKLPDTVSVAGAWENAKVELLADWTWTGWSTLPALTIYRSGATTPLEDVPLSFRDTWRAGLGANVKMNQAWTLRLGTAYDKSPVQDQYRTPRLPDNSRVWAAGGLQWRPTESVHVDLSYAHLFLKDAPSSLPNQDSATATPVGDLNGEYHAHVNIVGAQVSLHF